MLIHLLLFFLGIGLFPTAFADGPGATGTRHYDPAEIRVDGVIDSFVFSEQACHRPKDVGVHFNLTVEPVGSTAATSYFVHIGPKN